MPAHGSWRGYRPGRGAHRAAGRGAHGARSGRRPARCALGDAVSPGDAVRDLAFRFLDPSRLRWCWPSSPLSRRIYRYAAPHASIPSSLSEQSSRQSGSADRVSAPLGAAYDRILIYSLGRDLRRWPADRERDHQTGSDIRLWLLDTGTRSRSQPAAPVTAGRSAQHGGGPESARPHTRDRLPSPPSHCSPERWWRRRGPRRSHKRHHLESASRSCFSVTLARPR